MELLQTRDQYGEPLEKVAVVAFSADRSLAIHRTPCDGKLWTLSHVKTGASILVDVSRKDAENVLDGIAFVYGRELRKIQIAGKPLAKGIKRGIAGVIRTVMGNRSPVWAMEA